MAGSGASTVLWARFAWSQSFSNSGHLFLCLPQPSQGQGTAAAGWVEGLGLSSEGARGGHEGGGAGVGGALGRRAEMGGATSGGGAEKDGGLGGGGRGCGRGAPEIESQGRDGEGTNPIEIWECEMGYGSM